jgi:hypothetical protein
MVLIEKKMEEGAAWYCERAFQFIEECLKNANPELKNAIDVSFIEDLALGTHNKKRYEIVKARAPKLLRDKMIEVHEFGNESNFIAQPDAVKLRGSSVGLVARAGYQSARYHMLNRYPDQTRSRRGFVLVGAIFLVFGLFMALVGSGIGAFIGALFGFALLLPSVLFGEASFRKFEKILSKIALFGSLS